MMMGTASSMVATARTKAESKPPRYGWLCAECYAAWDYVQEQSDELEVLDRDGNRVA
jgi:hypothetical protein